MHMHITIGDFLIPSYGVLIVLGVIAANIIAFFLIKKYKMDVNDFLILEAYVFLGAFLGAKIFYLFVSRDMIDWTRFFQFEYFNQLMLSGFVFYGGLILGLLLVFIMGKIHNINSYAYIVRFVFLIPLVHGFGRIGCFMAGCCYGVPYDGVFAVCFPAGSLAPTGIDLFPVQIFESIGLLLISLLLLFLQIFKNWKYPVETYLFLYSILRFTLEFYRYDDTRGSFLVLSTSQWISIILGVLAILSFLRRRGRNAHGCAKQEINIETKMF